MAKENIEISQEKAKEHFDKGRREDEFNEGELVYIKYPNRKVGLSEKLLYQYRGPYEVIRKTAPNNYEVRNSNGKSDLVAVERMKHYKKRKEQNVTFEDKVSVKFLESGEIIELPINDTQTELGNIDLSSIYGDYECRRSNRIRKN